MSPHCNDALSYPTKGHLPQIDLEAEAKPCHLRGKNTSTQITTLNNQRTGNLYKLQISVRPKFKGVIINGDAALTEYVYSAPVVRSGKQIQDRGCKMSVNPNNQIPGDEISTSFVFYDSTQVNGSNYGQSETACIEYTVDLN